MYSVGGRRLLCGGVGLGKGLGGRGGGTSFWWVFEVREPGLGSFSLWLGCFDVWILACYLVPYFYEALVQRNKADMGVIEEVLIVSVMMFVKKIYYY